MDTEKAPSLEEVVEAVRTLDMVRSHVKGFGSLSIDVSMKRGRGRVMTARVHLGPETHRRYVNPELVEIIQPAVDLLTTAMRDWNLTIDTDARPMTVTVRA